jgi:hypothetical protein
MQEDKHHSEIEGDLPANDSLHEFCDVDQILPGDPSPIVISSIPPKLRLKGEIKRV